MPLDLYIPDDGVIRFDFLMIKYLPHYDRTWGDLGYAKPGDAGFDLRAAIDAPLEIYPGRRRLVPCGVKIAIPDGYEIQVRSRSGLSSKQGLIVLNAPGTIDAGYRGEIFALMHNTDPDPQVIQPGDRVAQGVLAKVGYLAFVETDELPDSARGETGFGSSGVR